MSRPTRVLLLAYYFPPVGGGGVQRVLKFCRYLCEFGYEVVVITGPGRSKDLWTPEDRTLLDELPSGVEIQRIRNPEPMPSRWRGRVDRAFDLLPPPLRWWIDGATALGRNAAGDSDVILGELVPYATAYAAAKLAQEFDRPWVADLQDPWALDEMWLYPTVLHRRRDLARMRRVLGTASHIVMNTSEAVHRMRSRFPELTPRLVDAIPNGFDPDDFDGLAPAAKSPEVFRIVHTGTLHTEAALDLRRRRWIRRHLGGEPVPGVDFLTRTHVFLLEAINRVVRETSTLSAQIELHLAGVLTESDRNIAATSPVSRLHGYTSHSETLSLLLSADLLFLPMQDLPRGIRAGLVPGKTYEYLGSGRPILAAVPAGDARDLLAEAGNAYLCNPADVAAMAQILIDRIAEWRQGHAPPAPRPDVLARYERRRQAEQLACVLEHAVAEQPP
jgi:glycosyltransferase involved in cell wall biosynthesis